jgi:hypothetical protein
MSKKISDLAVGDAAYAFGGFPRGATGGAEVIVTRVGRAYVCARRPGEQYDREIKFSRETGVEAADTNYKRLLVIDREAHMERSWVNAAYHRLRRELPLNPPDGITRADLEAAARLLRVDL